GSGDGYRRRAALLAEAGISPVPVAADSPLPKIGVLFVAGLDQPSAAALAAKARAAGILVNVEDVPELCDFHVPAIVRRGDLVLTASTGGHAPGLPATLFCPPRPGGQARGFPPRFRDGLGAASAPSGSCTWKRSAPPAPA